MSLSVGRALLFAGKHPPNLSLLLPNNKWSFWVTLWSKKEWIVESIFRPQHAVLAQIILRPTSWSMWPLSKAHQALASTRLQHSVPGLNLSLLLRYSTTKAMETRSMSLNVALMQFPTQSIGKRIEAPDFTFISDPYRTAASSRWTKSKRFLYLFVVLKVFVCLSQFLYVLC